MLSHQGQTPGMTEMGAVVTPLGSRQFGDYIQAEMRKWADVIAENKITFQ